MKVMVCVPTPSPERVVPLLWEGPLSTNPPGPGCYGSGGGDVDGQGSGLLRPHVGAGFGGECFRWLW